MIESRKIKSVWNVPQLEEEKEEVESCVRPDGNILWDALVCSVGHCETVEKSTRDQNGVNGSDHQDKMSR